MADPTVQMKFAGDSKSAEAAISKLEKQYDKLEAKMRKAGQTSKKTGDATGGMNANLRRAVSSIATYVSMAGVAAKVVEGIKGDWQKIVDLQSRSAQAQITSGGTLRKLLVNFAPDKTLSRAQVAPAYEKISKETGADVNALYAAGEAAHSAKGSRTNRDVLNAVEVAARINPGDPDTIRVMSARLLDLQKIQERLTARGGAGFLTQVGGAARVTALPKLGKTLVPAALALRKSGDTLEQAGELYATVTQLTGDEEGDQAKTALISLAKQLREYKGFKGRKDATSTTARIGILQKDPRLRAEFLKKATFEVGTEAGVRALVSGDADAMKALRASQAAIKPALDPSQIPAFEKWVGDINRSALQPQANAERRLKGAEQRELLNDPQAFMTTKAREALNTVIDKTNLVTGPDFAAAEERRTMFEARTMISKNPIREAITELKDIRDNTGYRPGTLASGFLPIYRPALSDKEKQGIDERIQILKDLRDQLKNISENTAKSANAQPSAPSVNRNANGERR
jgi:hypothetical protein